MNTANTLCLLTAALLAGSIVTTPALAGSGGDIPCGSKAGFVRERSINPANFQVRITGPDGKVLVPQPPKFPVFAKGVALAGGGFGVDVDIPAFPFTCDVKNRTIPLPKKKDGPLAAGPITEGGEMADLSLEAIQFDSVSGTYSLEGLFGRLQVELGNGVFLSIPDLYADTNGDGVIGDGDLLYSMVDINTYLKAPPSFNLGDTFDIVNGSVAGLPGMKFSTTPFDFDPATGFSNGTPFTGVGDVESLHDVASVSEPGTVFLFCAALAGLAVSRRRQENLSRS
ncbi:MULTISPECIES: PEP-CTERM sorting domain-containing protein [unclassified Duganella]|uniref:PEP-CTERM sorting domain-containing protein n=1 Tax=unclassified Duganella TaxID=2636909 RepID=UPI000E34A7AB|nr:MULTISPECIES: PEP-CTERM sorting domain-containing protein [unclassified Duganella]RFP08660.1 PEP-CTERM sorting domain-containing protein [Duganella sp. BJB475]RFP27486.1 PEP-CTERM sorting domain-containing protein [Duganella sp. BJB476]